MTATYQTRFTAQCPVDGTTDIYDLTVVSEQMIPVEEILEAIKDSTQHLVFQEEIHGNLSARLPDASITIVGTHSGVLTTVTS